MIDWNIILLILNIFAIGSALGFGVYSSIKCKSEYNKKDNRLKKKENDFVSLSDKFLDERNRR
jgi:hypothetical protein